LPAPFDQLGSLQGSTFEHLSSLLRNNAYDNKYVTQAVMLRAVKEY